MSARRGAPAIDEVMERVGELNGNGFVLTLFACTGASSLTGVRKGRPYTRPVGAPFTGARSSFASR